MSKISRTPKLGNVAEPVAQRSRKRRLDADRSRTAVLDAAIAVLGRQADASIEDIATCNRYACEASFIPEASKRRIWEKYFS